MRSDLYSIIRCHGHTPHCDSANSELLTFAPDSSQACEMCIVKSSHRRCRAMIVDMLAVIFAPSLVGACMLYSSRWGHRDANRKLHGDRVASRRNLQEVFGIAWAAIFSLGCMVVR